MMKTLKIRKLLVIFPAGLLLLVVLGGVGVFFLNRYLNSPGFLNQVRREAQDRLGFTVGLTSLRVSITRGFSLRKFSLDSPVPGSPPLMRADEIRIGYRLLPLLKKKIEINRILLVRPRFDLKLNQQGELELPEKQPPRRRRSKGKSSRKKAPPASPWTVEIKSLRIKSGSGDFSGPGYSFSVAGLDLNARLRRAPDLLRFQGRINLRQVDFNRQPLLRNLSFSPRGEVSGSASRGKIICDNLSGKLWGGELTGRVSARSEGGDRPPALQAALSLQNLQSRLIRIGASAPPPVEGEISGSLTVEGGLLPSRRLWPEVSGEIKSERLQVKSLGTLTDLIIPIKLAAGELRAEPITAGLADGKISGKFKSDLNQAPLYPFAARLTWSDLNLSALLKANPELRSALGETTRLTGTLSGHATGEGRLSEAEQAQARGEISIRDGSVTGNSYQKMIYQLTGQKRFKNIEFDQARADFTFARKVFELTRLILHSYRVKITSSGTVDLNRDSYLNFKIGLNFHQDLIEDIKPAQLQYALKPISSDPEYRGIEFHLWGVPGKVRSDYQKVLLQSGAAGWLQSELLKKDKRKDSTSGEDDKEQMIEDGINMLFKIFQ